MRNEFYLSSYFLENILIRLFAFRYLLLWKNFSGETISLIDAIFLLQKDNDLPRLYKYNAYRS